VVGTGGVTGIDDVVALRGAGIAFSIFGNQAALTECNFVRSDNLALGEELHDVVLLEDQNGVGMNGRGLLRRGECAEGEEQEPVSE